MQTETLRQAIKGGLENLFENLLEDQEKAEAIEKAEATFRRWEEDGTLEKVMVEARQVIARAQEENPLVDPAEAATAALNAYVNDAMGMKL